MLTHRRMVILLDRLDRGLKCGTEVEDNRLYRACLFAKGTQLHLWSNPTCLVDNLKQMRSFFDVRAKELVVLTLV